MVSRGLWPAAVLALLVLVAALGAGAEGAGLNAPAGAPIVTVSPGARSASPPGTFVSLVPSCACAKRTALAQFSLRDGRRLRTLAELGSHTPPSFQASDPHPGPGHSFDLTFSRGPLCAGLPGVVLTVCNPLANSCTSFVEAISPRRDSVTTGARPRTSSSATPLGFPAWWSLLPTGPPPAAPGP